MKMPRAVFAEISGSGLGIEIRHQQQKLWRKPTLQSMGNPAVVSGYLHTSMQENRNVRVCSGLLV